MEPFTKRTGDISVEPMMMIKEDEQEVEVQNEKEDFSITDNHSMTQ